MTAFEILLNKLYDTIEENEPKSTPQVTQFKSKELFPTIRSFVDISFSHGHKLSYKNILSELIENAAIYYKTRLMKSGQRLSLHF